MLVVSAGVLALGLEALDNLTGFHALSTHDEAAVFVAC